jgi:hypothetical protein
MGQVKLNIIGYNNPYIFDENYDTITLRCIYKYLIKKNILLKKLLTCKFIYSGQLFQLDKHKFEVNDMINIYILFPPEDNEFKNDFIKKLFNIDINKELNDNLDEIEEVELNTELCSYFKDKDFINLLNIVKTKPEYLEMVNSYLSHGDIIDSINFDDIDIENFEYEEQLNILNKDLRPNINNWDEDKIKKLLIEYDGNVNLVSRYILV